MHRIFAAAVTFFILITALSGCLFQKSDEELIEARIDSFLTAYNTGDFNEVLECLDAKTRNAFKSAVGLTETVLHSLPKVGGVLGNISMSGLLSDLFGVGIRATSEDDVLTVDILQINIKGDKNATVDVTMNYKNKLDEFSEEAVFTMVKESGDWYIKDFKNK